MQMNKTMATALRWSDVRNGCLAQYLAMKTALDVRSSFAS
jgi:hypothetical protein